MKNDRPAPSQKDSEKSELRQYFSLSALGIEIGIALAIGILIGWYLDRLFGTEPWFTIIFTLFGIVAGFRNIVRLARKDWDAERKEKRKGDSP